MKLRPYQEEVVSKMVWANTLPGNDVVTVAQGGGKTHIIAEYAARTGSPLLILVPSKELLEQDYEKLSAVVPKQEIGLFSASVNSKEVKKYTLATIQSAYKHPEMFKHYTTAIIDEADLLNPKSLDGMYNTFFREIGIQKVFGLTGTPFRQDTMYERWGSQRWMVNSITTTKIITRMRPMFWNRMLVVVNTDTLVEQGYLSPLVYHDVSLYSHEQIPTNKSQSDFDMEKFDVMLEEHVQRIANYIIGLEHKSKLVFCPSIEQANELQTMIPESVVVTSETSKKERARVVSELKAGNIRVVLNVGIFTVGFDYPELDCIVLLRPTRSLRLHCQILGRVSRIAEGKTEGHVYDLVGNIKALGQLADIRVQKDYTGKWNVMGGSYPNGFHGAPLYTHKLQKPKPRIGESELL